MGCDRQENDLKSEKNKRKDKRKKRTKMHLRSPRHREQRRYEELELRVGENHFKATGANWIYNESVLRPFVRGRSLE